MTFGLRCSQPARRPHPASLSIRVPTVESLLRASFSFTSRLRLAFRYGCRHRLRLAPFIQQDSAHAGHTGARAHACCVHTRVNACMQASPDCYMLRMKLAMNNAVLFKIAGPVLLLAATLVPIWGQDQL